MTGLLQVNHVCNEDASPPDKGLELAIHSPTMAYDSETIRRARILAGLTQAQLGALVGSLRSVTRWESGEGITERSPHFKLVEAELRLKDPQVLKAIRDLDEQQTEEPVPVDFTGHPRHMPDSALLATIDLLMAELRRRFMERAIPVRRFHGQPGSYQADMQRLRETSQTGDGSSPDRAASQG